MRKRLYHRTSAKCAALILKQGFRDGNMIPIGDMSVRGVWLSNKPLDTNEGTKSGESLIEVRVDLPKSAFNHYELIEEGKPYREWCFPAKLLTNAQVRETNDID